MPLNTTAVKELRKRLNLTQTEMGLRLGVGCAAISTYETGIASPKMKILDAIYELARTTGNSDLEFYLKEVKRE
jgi:transcriptional regulator with XRE-family HTH domain